ncbi:hypothetical protein ACQPZZ_06675 [Microbispora sp. CA-135349]|uniref:hypothetical protein n=1 Tax=Microbispora sp. CA-135349 TaxID=3239953 RepID=UPI003D8E34E6
MKRAFMALACAATAALVAPAVAAPAQAHTTGSQARPLDPVAALRKQFVPGHGVRFTSSATIDFGGMTTVRSTAKGALAFGRSGIAASDVSQKIDYGALLEDKDLKGADKPTRTITIGRTAYTNGGVFSSLFPEGKKWLRSSGDARVGALRGTGEFVDPLDWRTLKTVLATTKAKSAGGVVNGAKTTLYRGTITLKRLAEIEPRLKDGFSASEAKSVVGWKMWIGADQLVRKVQTSLTMKLRFKKTTIEVDATNVTSLVGWGSRVTVKAPPKSQVARLSDLLGDVPDMPDTINLGD